MRTFTYDVECYRNYFLVAFEDVETREVFRYELREQFIKFEREVRVEIHKLMCNSTFVGYNSSKYDILMVWAALCGKTANELKDISDDIIHNYHTPWNFCQNLGLKDIHQYDNHIDLAPYLKPSQDKKPPSLKTCAGRLFAPKMQDLPYDPHVILTSEQQDFVRDYNTNDLDVTRRLYERLAVEINLRVELGRDYGVDLRSKSDAQIAEVIIGKELEKALGRRVFKPEFNPDLTFGYKPPDFINFKNPVLKNIRDKVCQHTFRLQPTSGKVELPDFLTEKITIDDKRYQMGIGGLHSCESKISYVASGKYKLGDADVSSYYPASMINSGKWPKPLGPDFLKIYRRFRDRRLDAKHKSSQFFKLGDKVQGSIWKIVAESLKIVLNGTFGKTGSKFSIFYDPEYMIYVTLTGQLSLLMLIERAVENNIEVVSSNTDGVVFYFDRDRQSEVDEIYRRWQLDTGYELEFAEYKSLYLQSVNSYLAVDVDGKVKVKTFYNLDESKIDIDHNPKWAICVKAVKEHLSKGTSIEQTILKCDDIRQFVKVVNVKGGGVVVHKKPKSIPPHNRPEELVLSNGWEEIVEEKIIPESTFKSGKVKPQSIKTTIKYKKGNELCGIKKAYRLVQDEFLGNTEFGNYLGKVVRFYKAKDWDSFIAYKLSGNKVPESENSKQMMDMDGTLPPDLDKSWYIDNAFKILDEIGFTKQPEIEEVLSYEDFMKLTAPKRRIDVLEFAL